MPELLVMEISRLNKNLCFKNYNEVRYIFVPPSMFWDKIVCTIFALKGVRCENHELGQDKTLLNNLTHDIFIRQDQG